MNLQKKNFEEHFISPRWCPCQGGCTGCKGLCTSCRGCMLLNRF